MVKFVICTNARDEPTLIEWACYHLLLGVDLILIFDHISSKPISDYLGNIHPNIKVIRVDIPRVNKFLLAKKGYLHAMREHATHLMYIDADEYIVLKGYTDIKSFIRSFKGDNGIALNWVPYGNRKLIFRSTDLLFSSNNYRINLPINHHFLQLFKTIHPIESINGVMTNPHFYVTEKIINVINAPVYTESKFDTEMLSIAYLAHFHIQSLEDYQLRHILRGRDDVHKKPDLRFTIPKLYYCSYIEDNFLSDNFSEKLSRFILKLKLDTYISLLKTKWCPRLKPIVSNQDIDTNTVEYLEKCFEKYTKKVVPNTKKIRFYKMKLENSLQTMM